MKLQLELEPNLANQIKQLANQKHSSPEEYIPRDFTP